MDKSILYIYPVIPYNPELSSYFESLICNVTPSYVSCEVIGDYLMMNILGRSYIFRWRTQKYMLTFASIFNILSVIAKHVGGM